MFVATGFIGGRVALLEFLQSETVQISAGANSFTFASANIGVATADRLVIVVAPADSVVANNRSITGVTIGGTAASLVAVNQANGSFSLMCGIAYRVVAAGTTANIVVSFSNTSTSCGCHVYTLKKYASATPHDTETTGGAGVSSIDDAINIPSSGALLVGCMMATSVGNVVFTGVTERADQNVGNSVYASASDDSMSQEANRAYSMANSTGSSLGVGFASVAASWR